ncbi:hypothetical protein QTP88_016788 [Uroleucon formosanum]
MEKYYKFEKDLYMIFVDYKQAYDSINRKELWKAMILFGIPQKYVNLVKMSNDKTLLKVRFLQRLSPAFEVNSGLRQRDALSPTLFNLGLEKVIRESYEGRPIEVLGEETVLAYADDIVLLGGTQEEVTRSASKLIEAGKNMGLLTYGCETWSIIQDDNRKLAILERKILRNIYGPVYNDNLGINEKRHNEELYGLYEKPNILTFMRCKRLEWLRHVWRVDGDVLKNVLIRKINKKRPLGRPRTKWKDTVDKDMRLIDDHATLDWTLDREK